MRREFFALLILICISSFVSATAPAPARPICEFEGTIIGTLSRYMSPTSDLEKIEGFNIQIGEVGNLVSRGEETVYPDFDCKYYEGRNISAWIADDWDKNYSRDYFQEGIKVFGKLGADGALYVDEEKRDKQNSIFDLEFDSECAQAGETVGSGNPDACCEGLKGVNLGEKNALGKCEHLIGGYLCTDCGNNICEKWEDDCSCPEDCKSNLWQKILNWFKNLFS